MPGFQQVFYFDYDYNDPNDVILVYEANFIEIMNAYYRGKKLIESFKKELCNFLESKMHKLDREASWVAWNSNKP